MDRNYIDRHLLVDRYLAGAVLFESEFAASWKNSRKIIHFIKKYAIPSLPQPIKNGLKKLVLDKLLWKIRSSKMKL